MPNRQKYLTIERFEKFLDNDFKHCNRLVNWSFKLASGNFIITLAIIALVIAIMSILLGRG